MCVAHMRVAHIFAHMDERGQDVAQTTFESPKSDFFDGIVVALAHLDSPLVPKGHQNIKTYL